MATRKSSSKPKLALLNDLAAVRVSLAVSDEAYTILGLAEGAYALIHRYYEEIGGGENSLPVLHAMRILDIVSDRLERLAREASNG
jgi:hypothetical protein